MQITDNNGKFIFRRGDGASTWSAPAPRRLGKRVKVFVDLPGPKLRAEIRRTQAAVLHFPRRRTAGERPSGRLDLLVPRFIERPQLPIPSKWFGRLRVGDRLRMQDAGGRKRELVSYKWVRTLAFAEARHGFRGWADIAAHLRSARSAERQRQSLIWTAAGGIVAGMLLLAVIAGPGRSRHA